MMLSAFTLAGVRTLAAVVHKPPASLMIPSDCMGLPCASGTPDSASMVSTLISGAVNGTLALSATVAVGGVMWGGFQMTRGGDGVTKGKNAILYSILGLVVIAMAYAIVQLVVALNPADPSIGVDPAALPDVNPDVGA